MGFFVYILQSVKEGRFYKGYSERPDLRLRQHNVGEVSSTRPFMPWNLVYVEELPTKREALIREKALKKADRSRINALISHPKNCVHLFRPA